MSCVETAGVRGDGIGWQLERSLQGYLWVICLLTPFSSNVVRMIEFQQAHARRERGINWQVEGLATIFPSEERRENERLHFRPNVASCSDIVPIPPDSERTEIFSLFRCCPAACIQDAQCVVRMTREDDVVERFTLSCRRHEYRVALA